METNIQENPAPFGQGGDQAAPHGGSDALNTAPAAVYAPSNETATPSRGPLSTTLIEKIAAWLVIPFCYCYVCVFFRDWGEVDGATIMLSIFTVGFMIFGEALHWKERRHWESFLWISVELLVLAVFIFGALPLNVWSAPYLPGQSPWEKWHLALFLHLFGVYWLLARGNRLAEGETSHMFVWDGITGFFVLPFKNFHLHVAALVSCFIPAKGNTKTESRGNGLKVLFSVLAVAVGIGLLCFALGQLRAADRNFEIFLDRIADFLHIEWDIEILWRLFLTAHVSAYVYGLLAGSFREEKERFVTRGNLIKRFLALLRKVPDAVWIALIAVFSVFYVIFFIVQGSYLFGGFYSLLPEGYTFSTYAREGFFELCKVAGANFFLLWLVFRTGRKRGIPLKAAGTVLTAETMLFAVIAFTKLFMYMDAYAFTPLRLQSTWLVVSIFAACICVMISIVFQKKTAKIWFIFSAVTMALMALI